MSGDKSDTKRPNPDQKSTPKPAPKASRPANDRATTTAERPRIVNPGPV